jgi:signal transduction histidine kinase/CheY-like chemotaxis protein
MIILIAGITAVYMETVLFSEINKKSRLNLQYQVAYISKECNFAFLDAVYNVESLRHLLEANFNVEEYKKNAEYYFDTQIRTVLDGFIHHIIKSSEFISGAYFAVHPDLAGYPYVCEVYFEDTEYGIQEGEQQTYEEYMMTDSEDMEWFYGPYNSGAPYWSNIYTWTDGIRMISYTEPVFIDGEIIGIVGVDITITHIENLIASIRLYDTGFALLKDSRDFFFETNDIIRELSPSERENLIVYAQMSGGDTFNINLNGTRYIAAAYYLENDYSIYFLVPSNEISGEAMTSLFIFFVIFGIALAVVLFTAYYIGKTITKPILKLTEDAALIGSGNLDYVLEVKTGDEVKKLADAFNAMIASVKEITAEKERTDDRAKIAFEANQLKSRFLATMSHEIRTPMNAILGIAEIQLQNKTLDREVLEALEKIYTSGDMLLGIINDILDLSKIEANKLELIATNYETASMISDAVQLNIMRIANKPVEFELSVDEHIPEVLSGDELRVKQILNNLLSNAFKYTAEGSVRMTVSAKAAENNENEVSLVVRISDTGQGMTKEQVEKLFDDYSRFNQEANRTTEGTGLGMSITNSLIRMMNGELSIESEAGKGSVFTVCLPQGKIGFGILGKEKAENLRKFRVSSRAQIKRLQIERDPMPYGSVLVVDDVETNIYVAKGLLMPYALKIDSADSGYAAIEKIKSGKTYDIIFMDHMMPKLDGIETTKILRGAGYDRPVVALTANAVVGQSDVFLVNGFDGFISKPIDISQLDLILNKFIRDKQPPETVETARREAAERKEREAENEIPAPEINSDLIETFIRDAQKSLTILEKITNEDTLHSESELRTYIIYVHGIKSALANVGKIELSAIAFKLEKLARDANIGIIAAETPAFLKALRDVIDEFTPKEEYTAEMTAEDKAFLHEKLLVIKTACQEYNEIKADEALIALRKTAWPQPVKKLLDMISEHLLHSDFDEIVDLADKFYSE